ncbi:MAG: hypothetical protein ACR2KC_07550 [Acidimicrobiales bacterium]
MVAAGGAALFAGGAARADTSTVSPGQGTATAQVSEIAPKEGNLALGAIFGEAVAGHQNLLAKAVSQGTDLGAVGTALTAGQTCNGKYSPPSIAPSQLPQELDAESNDPSAAAGKTATQPGASQYVKASGTPFSEATTTIAPFAIPQVINIGGGTAHTYSGLVNGVRVAGASVDVGPVTLQAGGVIPVNIGALHWEASYPSTPSAKPTGQFTMSNVTIPGTVTSITGVLNQITHTLPVPIPLPTDPQTAVSTLNTILHAAGLMITYPAVHVANGLVWVDPFKIQVVPNASRDTALAAVISGAQPIRQPLIDAVHTYEGCGGQSSATNAGVTVTDVFVASLTGGGTFDVVLGGLQASSGDLAGNNFNLSLPGLASNALGTADTTPVGNGSSSVIPGTSGTPGSDIAGTPAIAGTGATATPTASGPLHTTPAAKSRRAGDALIALGLGGLGLMGLLAEGDRRMMRRAQRFTASFEE